MKSKRNILLLSIIFIAFITSGCATTKIAEQANQGVLCPQCQTVWFDPTNEYDPYSSDMFDTGHACPGCKGMVTSFLRKGDIQHECSICERNPYECKLSRL